MKFAGFCFSFFRFLSFFSHEKKERNTNFISNLLRHLFLFDFFVDDVAGGQFVVNVFQGDAHFDH